MRFCSLSLLLVLVSGLAHPPSLEAQPRGSVTGVPTAAATAPVPIERQLENNYRIAVGDDISFRILEDQDAPVILPVNEAGQIDVPFMGKVQAVNKTPHDLALEIKHCLEGSLYKKATVVIYAGKSGVGDSVPRRIYLVGEVNHKGPFELPNGEVLTLSRAILRAGGFSEFADAKRVKLIRKVGNITMTTIVNVAAITSPGSIERDPALAPGDVILVPGRMQSW
jgi:protein involved in polysaccharide export with SLBB domain